MPDRPDGRDEEFTAEIAEDAEDLMGEAERWRDWLAENQRLVEADILRLASAQSYLLRDATPPESAGVYMFLVDEEVKYVGEAKGSGGLCDRIMRKHLSGSDAHPLQREFMHPFPDRQQRREFLKNHISVKWVEVDDHDRVPTVERLVIQMLKPAWNRD